MLKSQGTSGKNRIRPEKFLDIEIPLPPLTEQRRIVAHIESLSARVNEASVCLKKLSTKVKRFCAQYLSISQMENQFRRPCVNLVSCVNQM